MCEKLASDQHRQGNGREQELVEHAVLSVAAEDLIQAEEASEQGRDPTETASDDGQPFRLGTEREREQGTHQGCEPKGLEELAAPPPIGSEVALDGGKKPLRALTGQAFALARARERGRGS